VRGKEKKHKKKELAKTERTHSQIFKKERKDKTPQTKWSKKKKKPAA